MQEFTLMHASSERASPRPWRPSPFAAASLACHAAALATAVAQPSLWPWALGAIALDQLLLTTLGLLPRSRALGPNWTRLPAPAGARGAVALTIDDGPDAEVTPAVLSLLSAHQVRATFFCIGERVRQQPALARQIVAGGHVIENHSEHHWKGFAALGFSAMHREIERAQISIESVTGRRPRFFRAPAGLRNPLLDPVLARLDLRLASWTRRGFDTLNRNSDAVLAALQHRLGGGDILLLHDGHAARSRSGRPVILDVLPRLLAKIAALQLTPVTLEDALR